MSGKVVRNVISTQMHKKENSMRAVNHTLRLSTATLLVMALGSYVFASEASGSALRNLSYVNRSIHVEEQERVGKVSTVNGDVAIRAGAVARQVDTVNG